MLPGRTDLTAEEAMIIDTLLSPYGVELTTNQILLKSDRFLKSKGLIEILDRLEMSGYIKGRNSVLEGYLSERRIYCFNHALVYSVGRDILHTRLVLDSIMYSKIPNL